MKPQVDLVVVGAGYVGLTFALTLVSRGLEVIAVDIDAEKVSRLQKGETPFFEEGIEEAFKAGLGSGRLRIEREFQGKAANWIFTIPYLPGNVHHYQEAIRSITSHDEPPLIMIRGTVPIGYIRSRLLPLLERQLSGILDQAFYLVSLPERSLAGAGLKELETLPQLIGGSVPSTRKASQLFERAGLPTVTFPSLEAAELAKVFTNFSRLVQMNLSNFLGILCQIYGVGEGELLEGLKKGYPRLDFLKSPSLGVGGFCLPKDALVLQDSFAERRDLDGVALLKDFPRVIYEFNQEVIRFHGEKIRQFVRRSRRAIAMGIAFKGFPRTDDTRDSVGVKVVRDLLQQRLSVEVVDRTVSPEKMALMELPLAPDPVDWGRYDAVLLLNNDPGYREVLAKMARIDPKRFVALYDPWRLVVSREESVFQSSFPTDRFSLK